MRTFRLEEIDYESKTATISVVSSGEPKTFLKLTAKEADQLAFCLETFMVDLFTAQEEKEEEDPLFAAAKRLTSW